jgi:hypothetical protein
MKTKPCLFCGSKEMDMMKDEDFYVECLNCGAQGSRQSTDKIALLAWNKPNRWAITELRYYLVPYEGLLIHTATIVDDYGHAWKIKDFHLDCVGDEVPGGGYTALSLAQALEVLSKGLHIELDVKEVKNE